MPLNGRSDFPELITPLNLPPRPGFAPGRLIQLARERIARLDLDLGGLTVLTEAASGVYGVTPIIAAMAGARRVYAVARDNRYGARVDAIRWCERLAALAGVSQRVAVLERLPEVLLGEIDIVTNSGNLRPIQASTIDALPPRAVIALMFEAWEFREADIDLAACRRRGIPLVGVNERHSDVDVFSYLGPLAVRLMHDAGVPVYGSKVALLCDNDFALYVAAGLIGQGAQVTEARSASGLRGGGYDAVLVALKPSETADRIDAQDAARLAAIAPHAIVVHLWGDMDRAALARRALTVWPTEAPALGHMSILLSAIGPDPVVRLQAGGLKAAEIAFRRTTADRPGLAETV
ncbi:hypothetical protein JOD31_000143 [Methylopila capsulata]|uniref:Uncharacterized protein n=1 Tax=Methylopila capsulata TaxID=61654 RepID=A0A9W6IT83_9HYPH|nr:hypothetical protein [Methylopila capsulata]MBM7849931.1 hypothetical protein [Methylopila capsulata]GLK55222.1 hypothetical protein GCM10008170_12410 [Methylopila capsulata]